MLLFVVSCVSVSLKEVLRVIPTNSTIIISDWVNKEKLFVVMSVSYSLGLDLVAAPRATFFDLIPGTNYHVLRVLKCRSHYLLQAPSSSQCSKGHSEFHSSSILFPACQRPFFGTVVPGCGCQLIVISRSSPSFTIRCNLFRG